LLGLVLLASNANAEDGAGGNVKKPTEVKAEKVLSRKRRIVGGFETEENQWPGIVAIFIDDTWFCGGSLITDKFVLTAADCVDGASYFEIMAGAHNVRKNEEDKRIVITSSLEPRIHPGWNSRTYANDIALIELPESLDISTTRYVKRVRLPKHGEKVYPGNLTTAIGWGRPSDKASGISPVLRMVENLPIISNKACNDIYGIVGDGVGCIDTTEGRGTCNGDNGGPLMMRAGPSGRWTQVGVTSFGNSAGCEVGYPDGFTRTEHYLDWIEKEVGRPLDYDYYYDYYPGDAYDDFNYINF